MKTSKTLFFLLGALLAALLTWWLAGDKQAAAGTSAVGMPAAGISAAGLPAAGERSALDVIATRTSVRSYRDCPVGADTVELLLRAAMAAPSAMNRQPWVFVVVDDKALLQNSPTHCNTPRWRHRRRWQSSSARISPAIRALPATGG